MGITMTIDEVLRVDWLRLFFHYLSNHLDRLMELAILLIGACLLVRDTLDQCEGLLLLHFVDDFQLLVWIRLLLKHRILLDGVADLLEVSVVVRLCRRCGRLSLL